MPTERLYSKANITPVSMPPRKSRSSATKASSGPNPTASKKRKAASSSDEKEEERQSKRSRPSTKPAKKPAKERKESKQTEISPDSADKLEHPIIINRAPVLELWGACVAHAVHPDLSWDLCLSIGSSISTLTAIAKGRSIGTVAQPDESGRQDSKKTKYEEDMPTVSVMGFPMIIKGISVVVKGKPKTTRETNLQRKFGEGGYESVKGAMTEALGPWKGSEEELDGKAFHFYERFRPEVAKGQKGWGRKGELRLSKIRDVARK